MNKLTVSVDTKNRSLPIARNSNYINFYDGPDGEAQPLPAGARFLEIIALDEVVWFTLGHEDSDATEPSGDVEDGTAPRPILPASGLLVEVGNATHFGILSSGNVSVAFWS